MLVFRDVSDRRRIERAAEDARVYAEGIVEAVREPLIVLDAGLNVRTANRAFYRMFGESPSQIEGKPFLDLDNHRWQISGLRKRLSEVLERSTPLNDFEFDRELPGLGRRVLLLNACPIAPPR